MSNLRKEDFTEYLEAWKSIEPTIADAFRQRQKPMELMSKGIELLETIQAKTDEIAPVNYEERITFIKQNITNYSAFRQLDELFKETEKKIARYLILQKKKGEEQ